MLLYFDVRWLVLVYSGCKQCGTVYILALYYDPDNEMRQILYSVHTKWMLNAPSAVVGEAIGGM